MRITPECGMTEERWSVIPAWPDYAVSSLGSVKRLTSHKRAIAGKVLSSFLVAGYPSVNLSRPNGERRSVRIHRLVAEAFIPQPEGTTEVNHKDATRDNNHVSNLEWVSSSGNRLHGYQHGKLNAKGECNGFSKLTDAAVEKIRISAISADAMAEIHGVSVATIEDVRARRTWRHL